MKISCNKDRYLEKMDDVCSQGFVANFLCGIRRIKWVSICIGCLFSTQAMAQIALAQERDIAVRNAQEQVRRQQQEQQQRQQLERAPSVRLSVETAKTSGLPVETPCFVIKHLDIKDASNAELVEFDWVLEQLTATDAPVFLGQCIGAQGVAWLIERTQKILVDRGFVTSRVLASPQDMSQGTLVLTLIPGRIHAIRLAAPVDPRANLATALPMKVGDILNLRDIEQALENLKRVPTAEADIQIEPAQAPGAQLGDSDLVVTYRQTFPLRLTVTADDSGTKALAATRGASPSVMTTYSPSTTCFMSPIPMPWAVETMAQEVRVPIRCITHSPWATGPWGQHQAPATTTKQ